MRSTLRRLASTRSQAAVSLAAISLAAISLAATGCTTSNLLPTRATAIRNNLTPELNTLSMRHAEVANMHAITHNENMRMLNADFYRAMYLDRPSRLTAEPIPR